MSDINEIFNKELSLDELDGVNGGTNGEWHILDVLFNGAELWDDKVLNGAEKLKLDDKIYSLTGFRVISGFFNPKTDNTYKGPDGTILGHYEFLDYLKEHYTMDEILAWQQIPM